MFTNFDEMPVTLSVEQAAEVLSSLMKLALIKERAEKQPVHIAQLSTEESIKMTIEINKLPVENQNKLKAILSELEGELPPSACIS